MMKYSIIVLASLMMALSSCEKETFEENGVITDKELADRLRKSPEQVEIGENNLILEAYVWRDFMPVAPPTGSKMLAASKLKDVGQVALPNGTVLTRQYIIQGDEVWTSRFDESLRSFDYTLEGVSRNGPLWEVASEVDVVC